MADYVDGVQLEGERQQEAEKAAKVHDEMREAHTRLKRLDKDLKQLTTHQVSFPTSSPHLCRVKQHTKPMARTVCMYSHPAGRFSKCVAYQRPADCAFQARNQSLQYGR